MVEGSNPSRCDVLKDRSMSDLFAAAPDLLDACKAAVDLFSVKADSNLPDEIKVAWSAKFKEDPVCQRLVAAITKAEGRSSERGNIIGDSRLDGAQDLLDEWAAEDHRRRWSLEIDDGVNEPRKQGLVWQWPGNKAKDGSAES